MSAAHFSLWAELSASRRICSTVALLIAFILGSPGPENIIRGIVQCLGEHAGIPPEQYRRHPTWPEGRSVSANALEIQDICCRPLATIA
jgi:hypothetical protein